MSTVNNSAGRLYNILRVAKRQPDSMTTREVWAKSLEIESAEIPELFFCLFKINTLLNEIESKVKKWKEAPDLYLRHFGVIRQVIACTSFDANWAQTKAKLTGEVLQSLEFCSELLGDKEVEAEASPEEFVRLRQEIQDLTDLVLSSQLPAELRQVLLGALQAMQSAMTEYAIGGVEALRKELFAILARLERHFGELNQLEKSGDKVVTRFAKLLQWWDTTTSVWLNTAPFLKSTAQVAGLLQV